MLIMASSSSAHRSIEDWIATNTIAFALDAPADLFAAAVDRMVAALGDSVELLGLGEPTHGAEEFLILRNRLFQQLVWHGYTAIAIESSFPRSLMVNAYVQGLLCEESLDAVMKDGFSHGFGSATANRELVQWMRGYNRADIGPELYFCGFDGPLEMTGAGSPRPLIRFVLDYLAKIDPQQNQDSCRRIESLIGEDAAWLNPAAMMDSSQSIGGSPAARELRIEVEELISELNIRRPELIGKTGREEYLEAAQHASVARQLLNYHAGMARSSNNRIAEQLGVRDAMMADTLRYVVDRERGRGKVFAFAHNMHLKRGQSKWQLGPHALR
jgi:erythromycin esterase